MKNNLSVILLSPLLFSATSHAGAPFEAGWSAELNLGVGVVSSKSQLSTDDDNRITTDLENSGKSNTSVIPFPLARVSYTTEDLQNQFFIGNSRRNIGRGQLQQELGYTRQLQGRSRFTIAGFYGLPFANEVWENPYLSNQARSTTKVQYLGGRVLWESIANSPITMGYGFVDRDVKNDLAPVDMRRDGQLHQLSIETTYPLAKGLMLTPAFIFNHADAVGDAKDYQEYKLRLTTLYRQQQHLVNINLDYGYSDYRQASSIWQDTTQADHRVSVFGIYAYQAPFGWESANLNVTLGYNQNNSNIEFYNSQGYIAAVGMGYRF